MQRLCRYLQLPKLQGCALTLSGQEFNCKYHSKNGVYGYHPGLGNPRSVTAPIDFENRNQHSDIYRWVTAYREYGHKKALVDPLKLHTPSTLEELDPLHYGLQLSSSKRYKLSGIIASSLKEGSISEIQELLEKLYCGPLTAEFQHMQNVEEREWFSRRYEEMHDEILQEESKIAAAKLMLKCEGFDHYLANKFSTVKRYGGEGAESSMCFYDELFRIAASGGIKDIIMCIAHRGRLNLLTCLLEFPPVVMFRKMRGKSEFPPDVVGAGDVLSHLTSSVDLQYESNKVHVTMLPNPSHLEAVNPVAVGKARGRMQTYKAGDYSYSKEELQDVKLGDKILCVQIHGDAAFAAQGIVAETFSLANLPHYTVGGSVHLIINNQIGFTTEAVRGRSSSYSSDVGKINGCPVIRVNADYPEDVIRACRLAMAYRDEFRKDVVVDLMCYRRWGHNEVDDPSFTQPIMYKAVESRKSIPELYAIKIVEEGLTSREDLNETVSSWNAILNKNLSQIDDHIPKANHLEGYWSGMVQAPPNITQWDTGLPIDLLKFIGAKSVTVPSDLAVHHTLQKTHIDRRLQRIEEGAQLDWSSAEALALGSLVYQGFNVRISGQDVGRGTFSHRHAMLVDQETDDMYIPLNHISEQQNGFLEVCNSPLSEEAVLGFEYGMSIENPRSLVIWEAQFGDFFTGAQVIIDTFITGGETKWLLQSGLVIMLPHGMDGAGPEHSSCRIERFLQLTDSKEDAVDGDDVNFVFANPTTPAQYYHLLRRQMVRNFRKPLIMAAPKTGLRLAAATSSLGEMGPGTSFQPVLADPAADASKVTKVVLCSGKHYYTLNAHRKEAGIQNTALIRLEALCPFPAEELRKEIAKYPNATDYIWSQEEHRNMGAWNFVAPRMENVVGKKVRYVGRPVHATPAVGVGEVHQKAVKQLLVDTFTS